MREISKEELKRSLWGQLAEKLINGNDNTERSSDNSRETKTQSDKET